MRRELFRLTAILAAFIAILVLNAPALAGQPQSIGLTRFEGIIEGQAVRLEWEVETENGTSGYRIKRGQDGVFDYLQEPDGSGDLFINAEGGASEGFSYSHVDTAVDLGETYVYQLLELTTSSQEVLQREITVTVQVVATNTPIVLPTNDPGSPSGSSAATATPVPATATARPAQSATAAPTATAVIAPSPLPQSTNSPAPTTASAVAAATPASNERTVTEDPYPGQLENAEDTQGEGEEPVEQSFGVAVAEAQEQPPTTAAYPGPAAATDEPQAQTAAAEAQPDDAPAAVGATAPVVISGAAADLDAEEAPAESPLQQDPAEQNGLAFLWIAFIAALTIFVAAVIGAIILYTRNRNTG